MENNSESMPPSNWHQGLILSFVPSYTFRPLQHHNVVVHVTAHSEHQFYWTVNHMSISVMCKHRKTEIMHITKHDFLPTLSSSLDESLSCWFFPGSVTAVISFDHVVFWSRALCKSRNSWNSVSFISWEKNHWIRFRSGLLNCNSMTHDCTSHLLHLISRFQLNNKYMETYLSEKLFS